MIRSSIPDADFYKFNIPFDVKLIKYLKDNIEWEQKYITYYGKEIPIPRLTAWYGKTYKYSGITNQEKVIPDFLITLLNKIEKHTQSICPPHNSVLLNWYRNGKDSVSMHQDNEKELGANPIITSLSLGYSRNFTVQHLDGTKHQILLNHGDILIMGNNSQKIYKHGIMKDATCKGERLNLTFRTIYD